MIGNMKAVAPPAVALDYVMTLLELIGDPQQAKNLIAALKASAEELNASAAAHDQTIAASQAITQKMKVTDDERRLFDKERAAVEKLRANLVEATERLQRHEVEVKGQIKSAQDELQANDERLFYAQKTLVAERDAFRADYAAFDIERKAFEQKKANILSAIGA